jgi:site-specific DNA-methyltransferase (adenine-specific)/adenine-specific DNA-methyltransferase
MPTLHWIGKDAVVNHHKEVPFRPFKPIDRLSVLPSRAERSRSDSGGVVEAGGEGDNLLIQGDNLEALKALLPYYAGQVKCIYIDPPYNTGNEGWVYSDDVNSPEMKAWLGKVWEEKSSGNRLFIMPKRPDWNAIMAKMGGQ